MLHIGLYISGFEFAVSFIILDRPMLSTGRFILFNSLHNSLQCKFSDERHVYDVIFSCFIAALQSPISYQKELTKE